MSVAMPGVAVAEVFNIQLSPLSLLWSFAGIIRVEVSPDGGKSWECAELQQCPDQDLEHMWAWTLWNIELPISEEMSAKEGQLELMCKATDRAYNTQPETSKGIWNVRGLLYNAWHRVPLLLERKTG
jgi:sulfite oxidase